ncbi:MULTISPECIES: arylsulfatase [unclassified Paenibacillus]|uniref:arylsulfatase n=1 Tax=unclassified Paenibacillus TaxID=185978 RepID=UPI00020D6A81|nr:MULTISPECIES: arylsulfatase [unclassified Paenibacillus]EGL15346.1 putative choline-sulfatase [Paenibacillus sp. HGF7]
MQKPNVLVIMTDQQRWDTLGCYGNSVIETPNLDWLASEGTIFTNAYTPSPSCVPARASLLTGMDPWNTGVLGMGGGQGPMGGGFAHTLPGELSRAGYHTQGVGKMHFHPQRLLNGFHNTVLDESGRVESPGFVSDYKAWFDANKTGDYGITDHGIDWNSWMARPYHAPEFLHPTNWTVNRSIEFLEKRDPSRPFFLMTSFARPHSPYDAPSFYFDLYRGKKLPEPFMGDWAGRHNVPEDAAKPDAWRGVRSPEEIHRARAGYYGSIHHIDHQIGRLLFHLRKTGLLDETLIVFTSDHGDMLGDHHLWRKTYAYEGSSHIPLLLKLPGGGQETRLKKVEAPVVLQDLMPTLLEAAGAGIPDTVDGVSLLGLIRGEQAQRRFVHGEHSTCYAEEQEMQYVTDGEMKYIWFPRLNEEQLFDLRGDREETRDVSGCPEYREDLDMWRQRLIAVLESRNAGLTENGKLAPQAGRPYLVSPHYEKRMSLFRT